VSHLSVLPTYTCRYAGCSRKATQELIDNRSSGIGFYCNQHGQQALKQFNQVAQQEQAAQAQ
jgi:hypothetical protein